MGLLNHFKSSSDEPTSFGSDEPRTGIEGRDGEKGPVDASNNDLYGSDGDSISSGQDGVKKAQATTIVWTRNALITAYAL